MGIGYDGCISCPVEKCLADYRGSECRALRARRGLDTDPITWSEKLRLMSAEEMAEFICNFAGKEMFCEYSCPLKETCGDGGSNAMVALLRTPVSEKPTPFGPGRPLDADDSDECKEDAETCTRCSAWSTCPERPGKEGKT